jgi:hypothetical protein
MEETLLIMMMTSLLLFRLALEMLFILTIVLELVLPLWFLVALFPLMFLLDMLQLKSREGDE